MKKIAAILLGFVLVTPEMAADCKCAGKTKGETTRFGGNIHVIVVDDASRSLLRGIVTYPNTEYGVDDALVEVFDHPGNLQEPWDKRPPQKRIAPD